ncbi:glutathione hydrolase 1 proenzyme-like isoform X2 [Ptychodera flava]
MDPGSGSGATTGINDGKKDTRSKIDDMREMGRRLLKGKKVDGKGKQEERPDEVDNAVEREGGLKSFNAEKNGREADFIDIVVTEDVENRTDELETKTTVTTDAVQDGKGGDAESPDDVQNDGELDERKLIFLILTAALIVLLIVAVVIGVQVSKNQKSEPLASNRPPPVGQYHYLHAAVASDSTECSQVGRDILRSGGSAVDSAIATALCLGVVHGHCSGIGGGFVMTVYDSLTNESLVIDATERAPQAVKRMKRSCTDNLQACRGDAATAGVPGEVKGYKEAHNRFGVLPWSVLFEPAIELAEVGFTVSQDLAEAIERVKMMTDEVQSFSYQLLWHIFSDVDRVWYREGDNMTRPALASTLRMISESGADSFYNSTGYIAQRLVRDLQNNDGIMTAEDLENYQVQVREPLVVKLKNNYTFITAPPPAGGAPVALMLNVLNEIPWKELHARNDSTVRIYHKFVEASKFAFAAETKLGDGMNETVSEKIVSQRFADDTINKMSDGAPTYNTTERYGTVSSKVDKNGGTHISVISENGDAVAMSSSINDNFGSKFISTGTGVIFNNNMNDFTSRLEETENRQSPNHVADGKRPRSPMAPSVVLDDMGNVAMVIGGAGGSEAIPAIAMVALRSLLSDEALVDIVAERRLYVNQDEVFYEHGFSQEIIDRLEAMGHQMKELSSNSSVAVVEAILVQDEIIKTAADPRKPGQPAGY